MIELTTQCPQCHTRFDLTLAQLQQRKGLFRCTHCAYIFDAYDSVVEPQAATITEPTAVTPPSSPSGLRHHFIGEAPLASGVPLTQKASAPETRVPLSEPQLHGAPPKVVDTEPTESPVRVVLDHSERRQLLTEPEWYVGERVELDVPRRSLPSAAPVSVWGRLFWQLLVGGLFIITVMQLVYVYRAQIANSVAFTRPVLQTLCDAVGCDVPYMREVEAIEVLHSALQLQPATEPSKKSTYLLQLQLKNHLAWPQEWPTLVLSFTDASAAVLATIAVTPEQYLPASQRLRPFAAGQQYAVRLPVTIPNKKINGFTVEKYYP